MVRPLFDTLGLYHVTEMKGFFFAVYFLLTVDGKVSCADRLLAEVGATACEQEFMVCNFTFDARNSQPASLLSRALT